MGNFIIRNEQPSDYRAVEEVTREAFWNLYVPGCDEHYLVHKIRDIPDFIRELSFVAELDGKIVGSIFFTKSWIIGDSGLRHDTITLGPVSVLPELHNKGIGRALIEYAKQAAAKLGHRAILLYGYPGYYKRLGFRHAKEFGISNPEGKYPLAHQVLELYDGALDGISGRACESEDFCTDEKAVAEFDASFHPKEKKVTPTQKVFAETSFAFL